MASIRTARAIAAVVALPLAAALFSGVAQADNGAFADDGSNATVASIVSGVGGDNWGNSTTTQQVASGAGASNQNNTASVNGSGFTAIDQSNTVVNFTPLWW